MEWISSHIKHLTLTCENKHTYSVDPLSDIKCPVCKGGSLLKVVVVEEINVQP